MKKQTLLALSVPFLALFTALIAPLKVQADGLPFSVSAITPATQRDKTESYYDVVVKAGQSTEIKTRLVNSTNKVVKVDVSITSAQTNDNGLVDYSLGQKRDSTLRYDLTDVLTGPKTVSIPANGTLDYTATLKMPAVDGLLAGGITFSPEGTPAKAASGKLTIVNKYHYLIAFIARNTNRTWAPSLVVESAQIRQDRAKNTLAIPLQNPSGTFLNQLQVEASAQNLDTGKRFKRTQKGMQMAPNSHFYYRLALPSHVEAGTYKVTSRAYYVKAADGPYQASDGTRYRYRLMKSSRVKLTAAHAKTLNKNVTVARGKTPWFVFAIAGLIGGLILVILLLVLLLVKKRRQSAE